MSALLLGAAVMFIFAAGRNRKRMRGSKQMNVEEQQSDAEEQQSDEAE